MHSPAPQHCAQVFRVLFQIGQITVNIRNGYQPEKLIEYCDVMRADIRSYVI